MEVDEVDFPVDDGLELGHAFAEGEQAVLHHFRVVLEFALLLTVGDVSWVVLAGGPDGRHEVFLVE